MDRACILYSDSNYYSFSPIFAVYYDDNLCSQVNHDTSLRCGKARLNGRIVRVRVKGVRLHS